MLIRVLAVVLAATLTGCASYELEGWGAERVKGNPEKKVTAYFAPGAEVFEVATGGGKVTATVERVVNDVRKSKVGVAFRMHNGNDQQLTFSLAGSVLTVNGTPYGAKDGVGFHMDANPDIGPNLGKKKSWWFELPVPALPGMYELTISDLAVGGNPVGTPLVIQVKVPGEKAGMGAG